MRDKHQAQSATGVGPQKTGERSTDGKLQLLAPPARAIIHVLSGGRLANELASSQLFNN